MSKAFFDLEPEELAKMNPALIEYQIQEASNHINLNFNMSVAKNAVASAIEIVELRQKLQQAYKEGERKKEWWATFRAVLTGLCSTNFYTIEETAERAKKLTDVIYANLPPVEKV